MSLCKFLGNAPEKISPALLPDGQVNKNSDYDPIAVFPIGTDGLSLPGAEKLYDIHQYHRWNYHGFHLLPADLKYQDMDRQHREETRHFVFCILNYAGMEFVIAATECNKHFSEPRRLNLEAQALDPLYTLAMNQAFRAGKYGNFLNSAYFAMLSVAPGYAHIRALTPYLIQSLCWFPQVTHAGTQVELFEAIENIVANIEGIG